MAWPRAGLRGGKAVHYRCCAQPHRDDEERRPPLRDFRGGGAAPLPDARRSPITDLRTHGKHVAFEVADLEAFLAEIKAKDVDIALIVREAFGKGCFIRDCASNLIEFVEKAS